MDEIMRYGHALSQRDRFKWKVHDARFDPWFFTKIAIFRYIASINWAHCKYNMDYQMFEIVSSFSI